MDISFSGSEVAVITGLLGAVVGAMTFLFRMLIAEKDRQIVRLEQQNQDLLNAVLAGTRAVEGAATVLAKRTAR